MRKLVFKSKSKNKEGKVSKKEDKARIEEFYKTGLSHYRNADYKSAMIFFDIASENKHKDSQFILGVMYATGKGVPKSENVAVSYYLKAAENGSVKARHNLGICYRDGLGVEKDYKQALVWFTRAAENGDVEAQYQTARLYLAGYYDEIPKNDNMAYLWFKAAAENDNISAQYSLGLLYFEGRGVEQDYGKAFTWFSRVADKDKTGRAYNNMGHMNEKGLGVPVDYKKAMAFYLKASYKRNSMAESNIGKLYELGMGVKRDDSEAMAWYRKSAEKDNANGQFNLGLLYLKGRPEFDPDLAIHWLKKAKEEGHKDAGKFLEKAIKSKASNQLFDGFLSDSDSIKSSVRSFSGTSKLSRNNLIESVFSDTESSRSIEGSVTMTKDELDLLKKHIQNSRERTERAEKEKRERQEKMDLLQAQLELQKNQLYTITDIDDSVSIYSSKYTPSIATRVSEHHYDDTISINRSNYEGSLYDFLKNGEDNYDEYLAYTEDFSINGEYVYDNVF